MIALSNAALSTLNRSFGYHLRVESWLGDTLLADDVPVAAATETTDRTLRVPERVTLTVPRAERGASWSPTTDDHPLAANGQRLRVQLGIGLGPTGVEWFQRGWYVIEESTPSGDTVDVTAVGLLHLIDEARLVSPYQPSGTLVSTVRGLIEPALTVVVDAGLTDRSVPSGVNYDEDRLGAVMELLDAWPADYTVTPDGYLSVTAPADDPAAVLTLTDGAGGTVIEAAGKSTREGAWNAVVARGTASDGAQVQGVAYDTSGGPKAYGGNFNPLPVPYFYASPLLTTVNQAKAAATTILRRLQRDTTRMFDIRMVPHPGLLTGDVVALTTDDYVGDAAIESLTLPWTAAGGEMSLRVRTI